MDIGCSEGKLLSTIKIHCSNVEVIVGVDIDGDILQENRFRTKPLMTEYLNKREIPLKMALYQGRSTYSSHYFSLHLSWGESYNKTYVLSKDQRYIKSCKGGILL